MLKKLRQIQQAESLTDAEMASRLGVARSTWTDIKNGRLVLSERVQMRAAKAFPELLGDLLTSVSAAAPEAASAA
ncbi:MAG TPA: helix-turn-helix domain-containing protein [Gaiellaceae bacterium]|nr:helix-turn-helix domain-containing protein [Gaiellaceae bacterium]